MFTVSALLSAKGKAEPAEQVNKETVVVITRFDVSDFPRERSAVGDVIARKLATGLNGLDLKKRDNREYDYYWNILWMKKQNEAAKQVAVKQAERDKLVFAGYSKSKYKRERKRLDEELKKLRETLDAAELSNPDIAGLPAFFVHPDNLAGVFPEPPERGQEYYLCKEKNADAILKGKVREYYGRILVEFEMWTLWERNYTYKDKAIFSIEDIDLALGEFTAGLIGSISGMSPSLIVVRASPEDAAIVIDDNYAGKGVSQPLYRTPGPVDILVYAENHDTVTTTLDIKENEEVRAGFELKALPLSGYTVDVKEAAVKKDKKDKKKKADDGAEVEESGGAEMEEGEDTAGSAGETGAAPDGEDTAGTAAGLPEDTKAKVYTGALFSGFAPLTMTGIEGKSRQISIEQNFYPAESAKDDAPAIPGQKYAQTIFTIGDKPSIELTPKLPPASGRTEKARKGFYGAFGRFWIGLPVAYMLIGISNSYIQTWNVYGKTVTDYDERVKHYDTAKTWEYVQMGAVAGIGVLAADVVVRLIIYIYQANREGSIMSKN